MSQQLALINESQDWGEGDDKIGASMNSLDAPHAPNAPNAPNAPDAPNCSAISQVENMIEPKLISFLPGNPIKAPGIVNVTLHTTNTDKSEDIKLAKAYATHTMNMPQAKAAPVTVSIVNVGSGQSEAAQIELAQNKPAQDKNENELTPQPVVSQQPATCQSTTSQPIVSQQPAVSQGPLFRQQVSNETTGSEIGSEAAQNKAAQDEINYQLPSQLGSSPSEDAQGEVESEAECDGLEDQLPSQLGSSIHEEDQIASLPPQLTSSPGSEYFNNTPPCTPYNSHNISLDDGHRDGNGHGDGDGDGNENQYQESQKDETERETDILKTFEDCRSESEAESNHFGQPFVKMEPEDYNSDYNSEGENSQEYEKLKQIIDAGKRQMGVGQINKQNMNLNNQKMMTI